MATKQKVDEEKMMSNVRNALLVAGQEMGDGDQWPMIKDTIYRLAKDFEDLKIERAVAAEMKKGLYTQLKKMEASLPECSPEMQKQLAPKIKELREVCDAYFSDLDVKAISRDPEDAPTHVKRMHAIIDTLEEGI